jgi:hypothetical protein
LSHAHGNFAIAEPLTTTSIAQLQQSWAIEPYRVSLDPSQVIENPDGNITQYTTNWNQSTAKYVPLLLTACLTIYSIGVLENIQTEYKMLFFYGVLKGS